MKIALVVRKQTPSVVAILSIHLDQLSVQLTKEHMTVLSAVRLIRLQVILYENRHGVEMVAHSVKYLPNKCEDLSSVCSSQAKLGIVVHGVIASLGR